MESLIKQNYFNYGQVLSYFNTPDGKFYTKKAQSLSQNNKIILTEDPIILDPRKIIQNVFILWP